MRILKIHNHQYKIPDDKYEEIRAEVESLPISAKMCDLLTHYMWNNKHNMLTIGIEHPTDKLRILRVNFIRIQGELRDINVHLSMNLLKDNNFAKLWMEDALGEIGLLDKLKLIHDTIAHI